MNELRWNPITRRWVVVAPGRATRPTDRKSAEGDEAGESRDPTCPFCPGNEAELPGVALEIPGPTDAGWSFRAVPNRFAAFQEGLPAEESPDPARRPRGLQEVLIESPDHLADLSTLDRRALVAAVEGYHARYTAAAGKRDISRVLLFRNRGGPAGSSLRHPHAQLVAMEMEPPEMSRRDTTFRALRQELGGPCPLCRPELIEPDTDRRVVRETDHFVCRIPWAAEAPFEVWIVPRRHGPDFRDLAFPEEGGELAMLLGWVARRYAEVAGDPDYNLLLHSASPRDPDPDPLHWWIRLVPRVGQHAGLELLTGIRVNPSSPEEGAAALREP
jgi:UDPglucose--hexose-1-phosphate uridylyltransferase